MQNKNNTADAPSAARYGCVSLLLLLVAQDHATRVTLVTERNNKQTHCGLRHPMDSTKQVVCINYFFLPVASIICRYNHSSCTHESTHDGNVNVMMQQDINTHESVYFWTRCKTTLSSIIGYYLWREEKIFTGWLHRFCLPDKLYTVQISSFLPRQMSFYHVYKSGRRGILRHDASTEFDAIMQNHTVLNLKSKWQLFPPTNNTTVHSNIPLIGQEKTQTTNGRAYCYLPAAAIQFEENASCCIHQHIVYDVFTK